MANEVKLKLALDGDAAVTAGLNRVGTSLGGMRDTANTVGNALAGLTAGLSISLMANFVKNINDGIDALNDLKDATGASIENISALEDVARRTGGTFDTVSTALVKLNQGLSTAKPGSDAEKAFRALGLSVEDLKKIDPAEAMRQTAVAMAGFADDAFKARLTQELFGKSLKEMAPYLKDLAEAGQLNATVTTAQAEEAEKFNRELFAMQKNALDVARAFSSDLVTGINAAAKAYRESGFMAGMKTLFMGNEQHQKNVAIVEQTEKMLNLEKSIAGFRAQGYAEESRVITNAKAQLAEVNAQLKVTQTLLNTPAQDLSKARLQRQGLGDRPSVGDPFGKADPKIEAALKAQEAFVKALQKEHDQLLLGTTAAKLNEAAVLGITGAKLELVKKLLAEDDAYKFATASAKARQELRTKEAEGIAAFGQAQTEAYNAAVQGSQDALKAAQAEYEQFGMSKSQIAEITLLTLESTQAKYRDGSEGFLALQKQITAQRELIAVLRKGEVRDASIKTAQDAAAEWKKTADQIEQSITDALMRGFESGKGFGENLRDTLENMFKTMILRPVIQAAINPVANALAGGSGGGLLGSISSLSSIGNLVNGGYASGLGAGVGALFGQTAGNAAIGTAITGSASSAAAAAAAAAEAGGAAAAAAGSAATIGSQLAVAAPWLAGALIVGSMLNNPGDGHSTQSWGGSGFGITGTRLTNDAGSQGAVTGVQDAYSQIAKSLGLKNDAMNAGIFSSFHTGALSMMQLQASVGGQMVTAGPEGGMSANTGNQAAFSKELSDRMNLLVVNALKSQTDISSEVLGKLNSATLDTAAQVLKDVTDLASAAKLKADEAIAAAKDHAAWQEKLDLLTGARSAHDIALANQLAGARDDESRAMIRQIDALETAANAAKLVADVHNNASAAIFGMQYGLKDAAGQYGMLDAKGAGLDAQMRASGDINVIAKMANDQISLINQAWGLLDVTQQQASLGKYEEKLQSIDQYVTQMGADPQGLQKARDEATAKTIADEVRKALTEMMAAPAAAMQASADKADRPIVVESRLTVTAPRGFEASIS